MTLRVYPGLLMLAAVVVSGGVLGVVWCVLAASRLLRRRSVPVRMGWRGGLAWALCPVAGLLLAALYMTQIPLAARVAIGESALLELVDRAENAPHVYQGVPDLEFPVRAGTIIVKSVYVQERCVFLVTSEGPIFRTYGLAYAKDEGELPARGFAHQFTNYYHLFGSWWTFDAVD